jgi:hypothetical protein
MNKLKKIALLTYAALPLAIGATSLFTLTSCEGKAERAGEKIDEAVDDAGDAVEDATDK